MRAPPIGSVANTTCLALYGLPSGPVALSAFARFDAVTFRRCDCADSAEPATPKMFINEGMEAPLLGFGGGARHHWFDVIAAIIALICWVITVIPVW